MHGAMLASPYPETPHAGLAHAYPTAAVRVVLSAKPQNLPLAVPPTSSASPSRRHADAPRTVRRISPQAAATGTAAVPAASPADVSSGVAAVEQAGVAGLIAPAVSHSGSHAASAFQAPEVRQSRQPAYPELSRRLREQGQVWLRLGIGRDGTVQTVGLERSSGHPRLDQSAMMAVRSWLFSPAQQDGQAVPAEALVPVTFSITTH